MLGDTSGGEVGRCKNRGRNSDRSKRLTESRREGHGESRRPGGVGSESEERRRE